MAFNRETGTAIGEAMSGAAPGDFVSGLVLLILAGLTAGTGSNPDAQATVTATRAITQSAYRHGERLGTSMRRTALSAAGASACPRATPVGALFGVPDFSRRRQAATR
jgi:hypothetical protein